MHCLNITQDMNTTRDNRLRQSVSSRTAL